MNNTENKEILIYDIKSLPDHHFGLTPEQIFRIYQRERIVLWDSSDKGTEPKIINIDEELPHPFIVDVSSTQLSKATQEKINKALNETGE